MGYPYARVNRTQHKIDASQMDKLNRLVDLKRLLEGRHTPITLRAICEHLDCSESTARRLVHAFRDELGAPLVYDAKRRGWQLERNPDDGPPSDEVPGLWFKPDELRGLIAARELLRQIEPGHIAEQTDPLAERIEAILAHRGITHDDLSRRVRLLQIGARRTSHDGFERIAKALLERRRLRIHYQSRGESDEQPRLASRDISPQRLTWYRNNWYLESWCHQAGALRQFALDRISSPETLDNPAKEIPADALDAHFASAFGIFAGTPDATAVLRFSPHRARWVAEETWHPDQDHCWLPDGRYQLSLPYRSEHPEELIMDILKYGPDCEVIEPPNLRAAVIERLRATLDGYQATPVEHDG